MQSIGVLALQGSFQEHCTMIAKVGGTPVEARRRSYSLLPRLSLLGCPTESTCKRHHARLRVWIDGGSKHVLARRGMGAIKRGGCLCRHCR